MLYDSFVTEKKNVKCTDSYDVIYLITSYIHLLFRCYYSIDSSVHY